jgi:hypothetical protein
MIGFRFMARLHDLRLLPPTQVALLRFLGPVVCCAVSG